MAQTADNTRILLALLLLQNIPTFTIELAAKVYNVGEHQLRSRQNEIRTRRNSTPKMRHLSSLEESAVVQFVFDTHARGFPLQVHFIKDMADALLADRGILPVKTQWADDFVQRHPELTAYLTQDLNNETTECSDLVAISDWFAMVEDMIAKFNIQPEDIWSLDEIDFEMEVAETGYFVATSEGQQSSTPVEAGNRGWATAIHAISGGGQAIPPFLIFAGQHQIDHWRQNNDVPPNWQIAVSKESSPSGQLDVDWLEHFHWHTRKQPPSRYRLLIVDGHRKYCPVDFQRYCWGYRIILLSVPDRSSYMLQPFDVGCLRSVKRIYYREPRPLTRSQITSIDETEFFSAFCASYRATMTEDKIQNAFKEAGLAPFNPRRVTSKLGVQPRTPSPAAETAQPLTPITSRTPETIPETQYDSKNLQKRVIDNVGSSLDSISEAITCFEKERSILLRKLALKDARIWELEEENEASSRRKRVKNNHVRDDGRMAIAIGQSRIDQVDADTQVAAESSRSRRHVKSAGPGVRHCRMH
ncbi:hypothetical protein FAUST_10983 [Fusarium austroamericanum]|uniref:HTH CENPB-type domain-containing protein n=1 Tax=Fusarium austroamericanum TaxID=282268 RepID=A0AAN5YZV9_FUSAU|nr:hypothetical protein FAUST_10983 [Fusarium austroamericanum]